jgi:hypothetical protein
MFYIRTQLVPHSKHSTLVIKTSLLTVCKAKGTVSSDSPRKHMCYVISMQNFGVLNLVVSIVTGRR